MLLGVRLIFRSSRRKSGVLHGGAHDGLYRGIRTQIQRIISSVAHLGNKADIRYCRSIAPAEMAQPVSRCNSGLQCVEAASNPVIVPLTNVMLGLPKLCA